jgi:FtsZ-interacting cell division protein ZipA
MFVIEPIKFIQIFNIADLFITIGGILFCVYLIFGGKKEKPAEGKAHARHESPKHSRQSEPEPEEAPRHTAKKARHAAARHEEPAPDENGAEEESTVYSIRDGEPAARPEPEPVKEPAAPEVKKEPEAPAAQPEAPAKDDMDFSLDDIMNEFK